MIDRRARARVAGQLGLALGVALAYWSPAFFDPHATGFGDWQMVHHAWEAGRVAIQRYGEWPTWNPFHCGGHSMLGNPESQHFTPFFLLSLAIGTTLALKVFLVVHAGLGLFGAYRYAKTVQGLSPRASALAAFAWSGSGFFAWHEAGGHATFAPFWLLPLVLLAWRRAVREPRWAIAVAAWMALVVAEGGTYPFPYLVLALALEALRTSTRDPRGSLRAALLSGAIFLPLAAVRLVPILETLARLPRQVADTDGLTVAEIVDFLTAREHDWRVGGHPYVWPEYGTFLGRIVLVLAMIGLGESVMPGRRAARGAALSAIVFLALVTGDAWGALAPWSWIHELPVYDSLRVPSRFMVLFTFPLAMLAGHGLDRAVPRTRRSRVLALVGALILVLAITDIAVVTRPIVTRWDGAPVDGPAVDRTDVAPALHLVRPHDFHAEIARVPGRNVGTLGCYDGAMRWPVSRALWTGDGPPARTDAGRVIDARRTATSFTFEVELERPGVVELATNFDPGWRASTGLPVESRGLLAVNLPAGRRLVVARFDPPSFRPALAVSAVGWSLALIAFVWLSRRRRSQP